MLWPNNSADCAKRRRWNWACTLERDYSGSRRHKRKRALILETQPPRYDTVLSDISGQDIEVHGNDPGQAIRCVGIGYRRIVRRMNHPFSARSPC